jgi:uncharacterized membrane protein (DUF4010 family)
MADIDALRTLVSPPTMLLLIGLSFFLGLAVEDVYARLGRDHPGGVRTFPLLALSGAVLYTLEPRYALAFIAGLGVLGAWLHAYYRGQVEGTAAPGAAGRAVPSDARAGLGIIVPVTNLLAYLLGPVVLLTPGWFSLGLTVTAVLLLGARDALHDLAHRIPLTEITTLGKFLILTGIVLPLLPNEAVVPWTPITPHQAWLAVVAVATLSYASYLVQRLIPSAQSVLWAAALGGLYSSTATTVVLSRRIRRAPSRSGPAEAGIVLATALMYLRLVIVIAIFDVDLALGAAPWLGALALLSLALAAWVYAAGRGKTRPDAGDLAPPGNPLEFSTAGIFALLFVALSLASVWVHRHYGHAGVYALAAAVGVTDIDPFVLSLAQGGLHDASRHVLITAVLVASSSNDFLKAIYAVGFGGWRRSARAAVALVATALAGGAIAARVALG